MSKQRQPIALRRRVLRRPTRNQFTQILHMGVLEGAALVVGITSPIAAVWAYATGQADAWTWLGFPVAAGFLLLFNFLVLRLPDEPACGSKGPRRGEHQADR